ncbi:hypothetical protein CWE12_12440 [Aliidiomarina sedimenti]|uniref:AB hydrolase-1 domain-containing protein n=1 Tax=Aliidiomarina sedimenti TaxID=1933879 RepID=A0ABY0BUV1_9GAMM|nr:hypothetical protein CWE12_12440 [Aliidiomarina sedimenti]
MSVTGGSRNIMRRNNVVVLGTGSQTIVLAHGLGCDQRIWHKVVPLLSADYRLVLFDYVGAGESDLSQYNEAKYKTLRGYADDLLDVVECLNLDQPYLLSHSASGSIGVLAEQAAPGTFRHLLMVSPSPRYINDGAYQGGFERSDIDALLELMEENYFQWANVMAATAMKNEQRPELAERLVRSFQQARPDIMLNFARAILYSDYRAEYAELACPVSVMQAADDAIVPPAVSDYLVGTMQKCELYTLDAQGHYPQLSHPAEVVTLLRKILNAALPRP